MLSRFRGLFSAFALLLFLAACSSPQPTPAATFTIVPVTSTATLVPPTATPRRPTATPRIPPPKLEEYSPLGGELLLLQPTMVLTFDQTMDAASVLSGLQVVPAVTFNSQWVGNTLWLTPTTPLQYNQSYTFTLTTQAQSQRGTPISQAYTWAYMVPAFVAAAQAPSAGAPNPFILYFNYALAPQAASVFTITPPLSGTVSLSADGKELQFLPERFDHQTPYLLHFTTPIADTEGHPLPMPPALTLETPAPLGFTGPPGDLLPGAAIMIEFLQPMDEAATEAAISISPALSGTWGWVGPTAIFTPTPNSLQLSTVYTVTINPEVRAADGTAPFNKPHALLYTSSSLQHPLTFGTGAHMQVVALTSTRQVAYHIAPNAPLSQVNAQLYRLTILEFVAQATGPFATTENNLNTVPTNDWPLVRTWTEQPALQAQPPLPDGSANEGYLETLVLPADLPAGLYLLNLAVGEVVNDQLLVALTEQNVLVKRAATEAMVWVTTNSGAVRANTEVTLYSRSGQQLAQGRTTTRGLFSTNLSRLAQPFLVTARYGTDVTIVGLNAAWQRSNAPAFAPQFAVHLYTDQPSYHPGQTVYFKAIARRDEDAALGLLPKGYPVIVRFYDAHANLVQSQTLTTTAFGSINGALVLAPSAMLGQYQVEANIAGEAHLQTFTVQDAVLPDYTLTLSPASTRYVQGETITLAVEARSVYGEPVPNAKITLKQWAPTTPCLSPNCLNASTWLDLERPTLEAQTDIAGHTVFTLPAETAPLANGGTLVLAASAEDGSQQTVRQATMVQVFNADLLLATQLDPSHPQVAETFTLTVQAQKVSAAPMRDWPLTIKVTTADNVNVAYTQTLTTDAAGQATDSLALAEAGYYVLIVRGQDAVGTFVETTQYFTVGGAIAESYETGVKLAVDKATYVPGDIAQVTITTPFTGPALLTLERGTTRREQLVTLQVPTTVLTLPIVASDTPNIYLTLNSWRTITPNASLSDTIDPRLVLATVNLPVPPLTRTLTISLTSDQTTYAPGATAQFAVQVTNAQGQPVAAELSLAIVDETLLTDIAPRPTFADFFAPRALGVATYEAFAPRRWFVASGGDHGPSETPNASLQRDRPNNAVWVPVVNTNANGQATFNVTLPNVLANWRVVVKAVTANTEVGEAALAIATEKALVVEPVLPPTLVAGDIVALALRVQNNSAETQTLTLTLQSDGLEFLDSDTPFEVILAPGTQQLVGRTAQTRALGQVFITTSVSVSGLAALNETTITPLMVEPLALPELTTQVGELTETVALAVPHTIQALPVSTMRLTLSRALVGNVLLGLGYLTELPEGAVEQTLSCALANATVGRYYKPLGLDDPALQASLPGTIAANLQRLYGLQHTDGGWGWWWDDASDAYQTAWVVYGLAVTRQAGYTVDEAALQRGTQWLQTNFETLDTPTQVFALLALAEAGNGDLATARRFTGTEIPLDPFSRAALTLALNRLGDATAAKAQLALLAQAATRTGDKVYWDTGLEDAAYRAQTMASATRTTALALMAFNHLQPNHSLVAGTVRYLTAQRRAQGWGTPNETAFAILSLTDYLRTRSNTTAVTRYTVELNGERLAAGSLTRENPTLQLDVPITALVSGPNEVLILQPGSGRLYYTLNHTLYRPQNDVTAEGNLEITRFYLDPTTDKQLTQVSVGQLVKVKITVKAPPTYYLRIQDYLPAGLAALNEHLSLPNNAPLPTTPTWQDYGYNYKELQAGRVSFFVTQWGEVGERTFIYYARALRVGEFTALPVNVTALYDATLQGHSDSQRLRVVAAPRP